jgi:hypothetical protein
MFAREKVIHSAATAYLQHDQRQVGQKFGEIPNRRMVHLRGAFAREHETLGLRMGYRSYSVQSMDGEGPRTDVRDNVYTQCKLCWIWKQRVVLQ